MYLIGMNIPKRTNSLFSEKNPSLFSKYPINKKIRATSHQMLQEKKIRERKDTRSHYVPSPKRESVPPAKNYATRRIGGTRSSSIPSTTTGILTLASSIAR